MSLSIRLKKARMKKHLTQQQLAAQVGIKQQAVQRIEAGKVKSTSYVVQLAQALDVSPDWLALGPSDEPLTRDTIDETSQAYDTSVQLIPLLDWSQLASRQQLLNNTESLPKVPSYFRVSHQAFALILKDDSMTRSDGNKHSFLRNDVIVVDPLKAPVDGGYVLATTPTYAFRRFYTDGAGGYLKALNHKYQAVVLGGDKKIIGVVVERITGLIK